MIFDSHAHGVDEYREKNGALKVTMIDDEFEATPQRPQADTPYRQTDRRYRWAIVFRIRGAQAND